MCVREREREPGEASTMEIGGGSIWWSWRSMVMGSGYGGLHGRLAFTMKVIMVVFLCSGFEKILI